MGPFPRLGQLARIVPFPVVVGAIRDRKKKEVWARGPFAYLRMLAALTPSCLQSRTGKFVGLFDRSIICALSVYRTPAPSDQRDDEKARRMENDNENAA